MSNTAKPKKRKPRNASVSSGGTNATLPTLDENPVTKENRAPTERYKAPKKKSGTDTPMTESSGTTQVITTASTSAHMDPSPRVLSSVIVEKKRMANDFDEDDFDFPSARQLWKSFSQPSVASSMRDVGASASSLKTAHSSASIPRYVDKDGRPIL